MLNVGINNCRYKKKTKKPDSSGDIENTDREYEPISPVLISTNKFKLAILIYITPDKIIM
jgi:hypothetical protein